MPVGVIVNALSVAIGGVIGALLRKNLPERLKEDLPLGFGLCAIAIGINSIVKLNNLTAVVLALLFGYAIGSLLKLESRIQGAFERTLSRFHFESCDMSLYIVAVTLFCCTAMGWYGAVTEGFGSPDILFSKSVLDFFTAIIFGASLGWAICVIPIPQAILLLVFFFVGRLFSGFLSKEMVADFSACGGIISVASGLRIAKIKQVRSLDMVPALILVVPFSILLGLVM